MKKFLTFLALACFMVAGTWAGNITTLDQVETDAKYTIQCPRGYLTVKTDLSKLEGNGVAGRTYNSEDACFQFQFVKDGDNYYLFNVGANGYSDAEGNMVANISSAAPILLRNQGNGTVQPYWDDTHNLNLGGQKQLAISDWKTADDGCRFTITKIELVNYTITVEGLSNGGGVSYKGNTYGNGQNLEILSSTVGEVSSIAVEGYVPVLTIKDTSITVKYISTILPDFTGKAVVSIGDKTQNIQPNTWYVLTQVRNGETPAYDTGNGNQLKRANQTVEELIPLNTAVSSASQYLLRFINISGEAHIIQFATGQFWNVVNSSTTPGTYMVYATTRGGNIGGISMNVTNDLTSYGALIDNNGKNDKISTWGSGKITSGDNNVWYIYPVEIAEPVSTATVTYNYKFNGVIKHTTSSEQKVGNVVAAPAPVKIFTTLEYNTETVVENGGTTVDVTVKEATPFIAAESFDKIEHWYAMQIRENNWLYNTGTDAVTGTSTYEVSAKYAWGFVGNIYDGYVIYNKEAGNAVALDSNTPCTISADGISVIWNIPRVGTLGDASFGLQTSGQDPINWQNNTLKRWNGFDLGSSFRVEEVDMSLDGALKAAIAKDQAFLTDAANLTALYSATDIATAKTAIEELSYNAMNQSSIDEATATLNSIMDTFYASANGKKVALVSKNEWSTRGATLYLTLDENPTANMTAAAIKTVYSVFNLTYNTENKAYTIQTVYTPNSYVGAPNGNSNPIPASVTPVYFTITPQAAKENAIVKPITVSQGLHVDGGKNIVGWDATAGASQWAFESVSDTEYNALVEEYESAQKTYTFVLTDTDGNEYEGTFTSDVENARPACVEGFTLTDEAWEDGSDYDFDYIYTATIAFPFPVNKPTMIYDTFAQNFKNFQLKSTGTGITVQKNVTGTDETFRFTIAPAFDGELFTFTIADATGNKVYTEATSKSHDAGVVTLGETGTPFVWASGAFKLTDKNLYLSVNSSNVDDATVQHLGVWDSAHNGTKMAFEVYEPVTSIDITIGATGYATIAYYETIVNKPEGLKVYYCTEGATSSSLNTVEWDKDYIPGYSAYILEGTPNTTYTVDCVDTDTFDYPDTDYDAMYDIYMNNVLIGNFDDTDMTVEEAKADYGENIYVFSKKNEVLGFYKYTGTTLAAHKAFYATENASINGFILDFEGTEGINSVISATNLKAGYDIQGRKLNKIQKGINILNGKKIIK